MVVVIAAPGPSLSVEVMKEAAGFPVIAVGDAWRRCPAAKWLYAADAKWWDYHGESIANGFAGETRVMPVRWFDAKAAEQDLRCVLRWGLDFRLVSRIEETRLSDDPAVLTHGGGSGYQAVNLAKHLGFTKILLVGFDMAGGHFFGEHPDEIRVPTDWPRMRASFETLADSGLDIINCSAGSALKHFRKMGIRDAIADLER